MLQRKSIKKLGQILLNAEMITEEKLGEALKRQKKNGGPIGKNLLEMGYIDEGKLTQCLAEQYSMPCISLDRYNTDGELARLFPESLTREYGVIPIDLIEDILTVGIADVPDEKTVERIQKATGFKIRVMMITPGDFENRVRKIRELSIVNGSQHADSKADRHIRTPMYSGKERRRFQRFSKQLKVKYEFRNEYNINLSVNVSQCGVMIKSKTPVPVDSHIIIRMELPTSYEDVIIVSRVVRVEQSEEGSYLIALNFDSMDTMDSNRLSDFMHSSGK